MIAWHYTIGLYIKPIFESGELQPADAFLEKGEKPILWFSKNQHWEQTAAKARLDDRGERLWLTKDETAEHGGGLFRFGIEADKLTSWPRLGAVAGMRGKIRKALEIEGFRRGAHFLDWCGSVTPVPVNGLIFEVMGDCGEWIDHSQHHLFAGLGATKNAATASTSHNCRGGRGGEVKTAQDSKITWQ